MVAPKRKTLYPSVETPSHLPQVLFFFAIIAVIGICATIAGGRLAWKQVSTTSIENLPQDSLAQPFKKIVSDPAQLSDEEIRQAWERIMNGTADVNDYQLQEEIYRRKLNKKEKETERQADRETFTKLSAREIRLLIEIYGNGEEKFIERLKTGGSGAGKVDLYKSGKTGKIYIKPKNKPNAPGEDTGFNAKDLKE